MSSKIHGPLSYGDQVLPHNLEAEKVLLGCLISEPSTINNASLKLRFKGAFFQSSHQYIFDALIAMYFAKEKIPIDLITLSEHLRSEKKLVSVGGESYLMELMSLIATTANIDNYIDIVHQYALLRHLIKVSLETVQKCFSCEDDAKDLVDNVQQTILEVTNLTVQNKAENVSHFVNDAVEHLLKLSNNEHGSDGIPSNFIDLDNLIGGFKPGEMFVLAARPSIGKTTFGLNIAANIALRQNKAVAVFSLEMSSLSLVLRLLCAEAKMNSREIKHNKIPHSKWQEVTSAADLLRKAPIFIDDQGQLDIIELRSKARQLKEKHNIEFIVIDYLQLMKGSSSAQSREQEVAQISGGIKSLAKELNIPIMILAQLNRQAESTAKPKLSHLRESGAIEQDADVVAILHRDREAPQGKSSEELNSGLDSELIIAKNRNGETNTVPLVFFPKYTLFANKSIIEQQDMDVD